MLLFRTKYILYPILLLLLNSLILTCEKKLFELYLIKYMDQKQIQASLKIQIQIYIYIYIYIKSNTNTQIKTRV